MHVTVDPERCQGHARCVLSAPEIFTLDDGTGRSVVVVDDVSGALEPVARAAADECPEGAISVADRLRPLENA